VAEPVAVAAVMVAMDKLHLAHVDNLVPLPVVKLVRPKVAMVAEPAAVAADMTARVVVAKVGRCKVVTRVV
jgi:hypothetical protein